MTSEPTITIPVAEWDRLNEDSAILNALEVAGVDNWEGYDYALESLHGDN